MRADAFDCCHAYNRCSDEGRCVNTIEYMQACRYWNCSLSKGIVFYGKNPGIREGHIYLNIDGRAYRISKRAKGFAYTMDRKYLSNLSNEFEQLAINYSMQVKGKCIILGCEDNPAKYQVNFACGPYEYTIRNYNGYLLERNAVEQIEKSIGKVIKLSIEPSLTAISIQTQAKMEYNNYYGRETRIIVDGAPKLESFTEAKPKTSKLQSHQEPQNMKISEGDESANGKWTQISMWDILYNKL